MTYNDRICLTIGGLIAVFAISITASVASIRMDGSEFQASSVVSTTSATNKSLHKHGGVIPTRIVATFAQPLMALGTMTPETSNGVAYEIGIGYEYNVLKRSYNRPCACPCAADPVCDGMLDVADVVGTINVAYRGYPAQNGGGCPHTNTDVNCSGETGAIDVVMMIDVIFRSASQATLCQPCD